MGLNLQHHPNYYLILCSVRWIPLSSGGQIYDSSEADRFLGSPLSRGYRLFIHDPNSDDNIQHIGDTPKYGTPLYLSKWFVEADLKIAMSSIVPAYYCKESQVKNT
ncbi:MAG: lactate racemase domain-containing protein [Candidatus Thorarchaeota archaeon]